MEWKDPSVPAARFQGRREMQHLAVAAVTALEQAGLKDVMQLLNVRLFDRRSDELCDAVPVGPGTWQCSYKPMVELLLYEVVGAVKNSELSREEQRSRITWALTAAGF